MKEPLQLPLRHGTVEHMDAAARFIDHEGSSSLSSMQCALKVATARLRAGAATTKVHGCIMEALEALTIALEMTSRAEVPAMFRARKAYQGYTSPQRLFLEQCLWASDALAATGLSRGAADEKVRGWAKRNANRLGVALGRKDALTDLRNRWKWPPNVYLDSDEENLRWWVENYRNNVEKFDDRWAYQRPAVPPRRRTPACGTARQSR